MAQSARNLAVAANDILLVAGELGQVDVFFSPNYVVHAGERVQPVQHCRDFVAKIVAAWREAFTGIKVQTATLVEAGDRVAWQRTITARHSKPYAGFSATGKQLVWHDLGVSRIEDGLIQEDWIVSDLAERMLAARRP